MHRVSPARFAAIMAAILLALFLTAVLSAQALATSPGEEQYPPEETVPKCGDGPNDKFCYPPEETTVLPPEETTVLPPEETTVLPPEETTVLPPEETTVLPPEENPENPNNPQNPGRPNVILPPDNLVTFEDGSDIFVVSADSTFLVARFEGGGEFALNVVDTDESGVIDEGEVATQIRAVAAENIEQDTAGASALPETGGLSGGFILALGAILSGSAILTFAMLRR